MKMCVFNKTLHKYFIICVLFLTGCNALNNMENVSGSSNRSINSTSETNALVSTHYAAGSLASSTAQRAWAINNVVLNVGTGCKSSSSGATNITINFGNTNNFTSATSTSGTFNVNPSDASCVVTITSLTLNSSNGVVNANNDGSSGTATYTFTGLTSQANPAVASPVFGTAVRSNNNATANPSYIFAAARLNLYWFAGSVFSPSLTIYYGENENTVSGLLTTSFPSIALSATTTGGYVIPAPSYCIATDYGRPCITNPDSSVFGITYTASSYVVSEAINLYPTAFVGATNTIASFAATAGQTAQEFKIITFSRNIWNGVQGQNMALVSGGGFYATSTATGGVFVSGSYVGASPPAGSNCGVVNGSGTFNDNSGCTYSVVDALWNNTPFILNWERLGTFTYGGAARTLVYGRFANSASPSNTYVSISYDGSSAAAKATIYNGTTATSSLISFYPLSSHSYNDLFDFSSGSNIGGCLSYNNSQPTFNNGIGGDFCPILPKSSQSSVRYLILKHTDLASGVPSYQMIVFSAGY